MAEEKPATSASRVRTSAPSSAVVGICRAIALENPAPRMNTSRWRVAEDVETSIKGIPVELVYGLLSQVHGDTPRSPIVHRAGQEQHHTAADQQLRQQCLFDIASPNSGDRVAACPHGLVHDSDRHSRSPWHVVHEYGSRIRDSDQSWELTIDRISRNDADCNVAMYRKQEVPQPFVFHPASSSTSNDEVLATRSSPYCDCDSAVVSREHSSIVIKRTGHDSGTIVVLDQFTQLRRRQKPLAQLTFNQIGQVPLFVLSVSLPQLPSRFSRPEHRPDAIVGNEGHPILLLIRPALDIDQCRLRTGRAALLALVPLHDASDGARPSVLEPLQQFCREVRPDRVARERCEISHLLELWLFRKEALAMVLEEYVLDRLQPDTGLSCLREVRLPEPLRAKRPQNELRNAMIPSHRETYSRYHGPSVEKTHLTRPTSTAKVLDADATAASVRQTQPPRLVTRTEPGSPGLAVVLRTAPSRGLHGPPRRVR